LVTYNITSEEIQKLEQVDWKTLLVPVIPQLGRQAKIERFRTMFSKLHFWRLTECDSLVYLDADMLVVKNFDELFEWTKHTHFAAVPDNWFGTFKIDINAGVLVIKPSIKEFFELLNASMALRDKFNKDLAEQGFLSLYYFGTMIRLPLIYNGNMATWRKNPEIWEGMKENIKILHFTLEKPEIPQPENVTDEYLRLWYDTRDEMNRYFQSKMNSTSPF
jgi:glycogenin glucosyltransferase